MITFQLDQCLDSKRFARGCAAEALCLTAGRDGVIQQYLVLQDDLILSLADGRLHHHVASLTAAAFLRQ